MEIHERIWKTKIWGHAPERLRKIWHLNEGTKRERILHDRGWLKELWSSSSQEKGIKERESQVEGRAWKGWNCFQSWKGKSQNKGRKVEGGCGSLEGEISPQKKG